MRNYIEEYYRFWFELNEVYDSWAKAQGLTTNALFMLHTLLSTENCNQKIICDTLFLPKQTVNSTLKVFEGLGYIEKSISQKDNRNKSLKLTETGFIYASGIIGKLSELEVSAFAGLDEQEKNTLLNSWQKLINGFKNLSGQSKKGVSI